MDRNAIEEELNIVNQYMDIEIIDKYNQDIGLDGFRDCFYDWYGWNDGSYFALRTDATISQEEFLGAVIEIIKKQPFVFIKSRMKAFYVAACAKDAYNLFLPFFLLFVIVGYALKKKDSVLAILTLGVLAHTGITILTMPASYFKYFWEMWLFSYFFTAVVWIDRYTKAQCKRDTRDENMIKHN